uniref:Uncharacterized protein n=1 Tax=Picea sitchensis TaxID=3332 RepID=A0A6B9XY73_PICSI|nr:hypothetical protein Q903MT_gene5592 [Picea sitchensis]
MENKCFENYIYIWMGVRFLSRWSSPLNASLAFPSILVQRYVRATLVQRSKCNGWTTPHCK